MKKIFYLSLVLFFFSSCVPYRQVSYFQDLNAKKDIEEDIKNYVGLKIQKNDILAITVSSLNPEASAIFNIGNSSPTNPLLTSATPLTASNLINGFLVDQNGTIQMPVLGNIKVEGLSTTDAGELLRKSLDEKGLLKIPVVNVRLANFKISILGDVSHPGVFPVQSEKVSIIDALSMAGDLTITGIRNNILLVREKEGKRQYVRLNINSKDIFDSPYFYLQNNDLIYVQPGNAKYSSVDGTYRNLSVVLSALSVIAILITQF